MGPITGVRVVNLRVRQKVAYPDLTLDLRGDRRAEHLVVGLENGGGKSTLLGAIFHVFVTGTDEFLPRRAQRRQGKEGEEKRLEHLVPGGDPTHIVVEVEPPTPEGALLPAADNRLLVGACLHKPAGSPGSEPAEEFFWSARSVVPQLTLRRLGLRAHSGRLLDHRELRTWLLRMREEVPAAQVTVETVKRNWEQHLRGLGVDVDYVRRFLLRMNEDEGAADQVFTYASSRAFLNSLVATVSDPSEIAALKQNLAAMAADADGMVLDRRRAMLLERLAAEAETLAERMTLLNECVILRDQAVDELLATRDRLHAGRREGAEAVERRKRERTGLEQRVSAARSTYDELRVKAALARVQVAELRARGAEEDILAAQRQRDQDHNAERIAQAAAWLCRHRTAMARIEAVEQSLREKAEEAEPHRQALSSAVQALDGRLKTDMTLLAEQRDEAAARADAAEGDRAKAEEARAEAFGRLGTLQERLAGLSAERARLRVQLAEAVAAGDLTRDENPTDAAARARSETIEAEQSAAAHEQDRRTAEAALSSLAVRDRQLAAEAVRTEAAVDQAHNEFARAVEVTDGLITRVASSGLVEIDPVTLDDHADALVDHLSTVVREVQARHGAAAIKAAGAARAAAWLEESRLLPPRPDVERLCARVQAQRLGARPGWRYLAELPGDVAEKYALAHPGLADGIVVNVPEDLDAVVGLIADTRRELDGPIVVGGAGSFDAPANQGDQVVVLPDEAFWSATAGEATTAERRGDADQRQDEVGELAGRIEEAVDLRTGLRAWSADIGTRGVEARSDEVERLERLARAAGDERVALAAGIADHANERDRAAGDRDTALDRRRQREALVRRLDHIAGVPAQLERVDEQANVTERERGDSETRMRASATEADAAGKRRSSEERRARELAGDIGPLTAARSRLKALADLVVRNGDGVEPRDAAADRELLTQRGEHLERVWNGAVTDPELRADLNYAQEEITRINGQLEPFADARHAAAARVAGDPARPAEAYERDAAEARMRTEHADRQVGELQATHRQREREVGQAKDESQALRRGGELDEMERTAILAEAEVISERLQAARDAAVEARAASEQHLAVAAEVGKATEGRVELLDGSLQQVAGSLKQLAVGGRLVPPLDLADRGLAEDVWMSPQARDLLATLGGPEVWHDPLASLAADRALAGRLLTKVDQDVEALVRNLTERQERAGDALEMTEALLRDAPEDVVKGDHVVQLLRSAPGRELATLVGQHHRDLAQRRDSVRHHVEQFDARIGALVDTVHATVASLLRDVKRTVRESRLPSTPAMGRWSGLDLLKIGGRDLRIDERKAAIAAVLRGWFDPERPDARPRSFDGDSVVHQLLEAATPQFRRAHLDPIGPARP